MKTLKERSLLKQIARDNLENLLTLVKSSLSEGISTGAKLEYQNRFEKLIKEYKEKYSEKFIKSYWNAYVELLCK